MMAGAVRSLRDIFTSIARYRLNEEAYKWSSARFYRDLWRPTEYVDWPDNPYNTDKWFGSDLTSRIYLKFGSGIDKTEVEQDIETKLEEAGYEIVDYDRNRCRKKGDKPENQPKITGILAKIDKTGKLVNRFNKDAEDRKNRIANPDVEGKMVVISRHPYDVAGMTTGRTWSEESCMRHDDPINQCGGYYHPAVISDILRGTLVAYFTDDDDTNLENPLARLLIKPYYTESGKVYLRQSTRCYPKGDQTAFPLQARQALKKWLDQQQGELTEFAYFKDGSSEHISTKNPISARMTPSERLRIINKKAQAGLYLDAGDTISLAPDIPTEAVLSHLGEYPNGAEMVASWIENQKIDIDSPYPYISDRSGHYGIFEYASRSRKRIKSLKALQFVGGTGESVLGTALRVAWETDIPRYLAVIEKNPEMLALPCHLPERYKTMTVAQYLLQKHPAEFKEILKPSVLTFLSEHIAAVYSDLVLSGLVPPSDPRWYLKTDDRSGYSNAFMIYKRRDQDWSVFEDLPETLLASPRFLESQTSTGAMLDLILSIIDAAKSQQQSHLLPKLEQLVDSILKSPRKMTAALSARGPIRIFYILKNYRNYLPVLLDTYGQDSTMLRVRDTSADEEMTVAHMFASLEPRWVPNDKSILALRYLDPAKGQSVSVLDIIKARQGKIGRYLQNPKPKTPTKAVGESRSRPRNSRKHLREYRQYLPYALNDVSKEHTLELLEDPEIRALLRKATSGRFRLLEVDDDGYVNFEYDISFNEMNLEKIPVPFGRVGGYFGCGGNRLQSLEGAPKSVGNSFYCAHNQLQSLEGAPRIVNGLFNCSSNQLRTLEGAPLRVAHQFYCGGNPNLPDEEIERYRKSGAVRGNIFY